MGIVGIPASFWRGGTSRGLILRAKEMAEFTSIQRDRIILTALGSPDMSGRQISGLGGGVSSLSKAMIIGTPGEGKEGKHFKDLPSGVSYADEGKKGNSSWDIVYRFAQVPIKDSNLDWSSTCGNMLSAVAFSSISSSIIPYSSLFEKARSLPQPLSNQPLLIPISILAASTGDIFTARVPVDPITLQVWEPAEGEGTVIAGVPGEAAGIVIEIPLRDDGASGLITGNAKDIVEFEGMSVPVSILSTGLPNIFISTESLNLPSNLLASPLSELSSHPTLSLLVERIRIHVSKQFSIPFSLSSPKVTLVSTMPEDGYLTSGDITIKQDEADLMVRAISSGQFHASIPGTTLAALNLGSGTENTIIHDIVNAGGKIKSEESAKEVVTVRAGHAAGVTSSSLRFKDGEPQSVVMLRTAREIFRGEILVPSSIF